MTHIQVHDREGAAGFTLIEMLVVLTIVATATGIAIFGVQITRTGNSPEAFAHKIGDSLLALRYRALNTGRAQSARFDVQGTKVVVAAMDTEITLPAEYSFAVTVGSQRGDRNAVSSITFLPDGSSSGAEISVTNAQGRDAKLRVNWLTGLVEYPDDANQ